MKGFHSRAYSTKSGVSERAAAHKEKMELAAFKKGVEDYARRAAHKLTRTPVERLTVRQIVRQGI